MERRAPAAAQALDVLRVISGSVEPVSASHIARELGLARSTTYYLLDVLIEHGYVRHHAERRRYGLGIAAHELGSAYQRQAPLRRIAQPIINRLVDEAGHNGHFTILHGSDVVYLIEERAPGRPVLISEVGVRLPAHLTASGLALLARLPVPQVRALFPSKEAFFTRRGLGPQSPTELRRALTTVRRDGYAFEQGWIMPDLASVSAAAVDDNGLPLGSFTLTFAEEHVDTLPALAALVVQAAERLSERVRH
ncbi:IclR family transcriptional regulator [Pimelobacter sp. 30-1]|uniref:IclR family transcriptional regulator n=1 Tax=Pimelobacter TaxID=2044 RepID=UPI001C0563DD|nr:IclR family transcriptional regulator [Pimelobacter sp. 30-1]MBU2697912.1 IclR family transcriptional regulator [Pimelobacter sp. 30-1]